MLTQYRITFSNGNEVTMGIDHAVNPEATPEAEVAKWNDPDRLVEQITDIEEL